MTHKCKFCQTPLEEHGEGECLDKWVLTVHPKYKIIEEGHYGSGDYKREVREVDPTGESTFSIYAGSVRDFPFSTDLNKAIKLLAEIAKIGQTSGGGLTEAIGFCWQLRQYLIEDAIDDRCFLLKINALAICKAYIKMKLEEGK